MKLHSKSQLVSCELNSTIEVLHSSSAGKYTLSRWKVRNQRLDLMQNVVSIFITSKTLFLTMYSDVLHAKICHMNFICWLECKQYLGRGTKLQSKQLGGL